MVVGNEIISAGAGSEVILVSLSVIISVFLQLIGSVEVVASVVAPRERVLVITVVIVVLRVDIVEVFHG